MYYFASDTHLGAGSIEEQRLTERLFVEWLERVSADAEAIFLCGDIFDFWFEYKRVVPRGFVRTLGTIASITDRGVRVIFMAGNHDMWVRDYLAVECGMEIYTSPTTFDLGGVQVHVAHGDALNVRGNWSLKLMNSFFRSGAARALFRSIIHPDLGLRFGQWWSSSSRRKHKAEPDDLPLRSVGFLREYALSHYEEHGAQIYIFGHLHCTASFVEESPKMIFMNDWSSDPHYATLDAEGSVSLHRVK
ncbi:MAG: UDP-2,3-diacylglucosamine diphosphatase [Rikenellaceae bacterium]